jgi:hypothetical protein
LNKRLYKERYPLLWGWKWYYRCSSWSTLELGYPNNSPAYPYHKRVEKIAAKSPITPSKIIKPTLNGRTNRGLWRYKALREDMSGPAAINAGSQCSRWIIHCLHNLKGDIDAPSMIHWSRTGQLEFEELNSINGIIIMIDSLSDPFPGEL